MHFHGSISCKIFKPYSSVSPAIRPLFWLCTLLCWIHEDAIQYCSIFPDPLCFRFKKDWKFKLIHAIFLIKVWAVLFWSFYSFPSPKCSSWKFEKNSKSPWEMAIILERCWAYLDYSMEIPIIKKINTCTIPSTCSVRLFGRFGILKLWLSL